MPEKTFEELQARAIVLLGTLAKTKPELADVEIVKELSRTYHDGYKDAIASIEKQILGEGTR